MTLINRRLHVCSVLVFFFFVQILEVNSNYVLSFYGQCPLEIHIHSVTTFPVLSVNFMDVSVSGGGGA